jgi:hypothetical protein
MAVENRGGMRPTAPQNNPNNISLTGGDGQNPKSPELKYRGLGYGTTGETNAQASAAPIKTPQPKSRTFSTSRGGAAVTPLNAESAFPDESILEGTPMLNPASSVLPPRTDNPDYNTIVQYLPSMEWWASLPNTPQTTKDYVRYLRTII